MATHRPPWPPGPHSGPPFLGARAQEPPLQALGGREGSKAHRRDPLRLRVPVLARGSGPELLYVQQTL